MDVIPSIYKTELLRDRHIGGTLPNNSIRLRYGEVKGVTLPTDPNSTSKLFKEYDVLCQWYEGGSATYRMIHNCLMINALCGIADCSTVTLRTSDKKDFTLGNGSLCLLLFIEGNDARGIIIGGLQRNVDATVGTAYQFTYNGVNVQINTDGSWKVTNEGKTDANGNMDPNADKDGAGTFVSVEANGNFTASTPNGKTVVYLDHANGDVNITASDNVNINATQCTIKNTSTIVQSDTTAINSTSVTLGSGASHPAVLGDILIEVLAQAFAIIAPTLPTYPQQAALSSASAQLATVLSPTVIVA